MPISEVHLIDCMEFMRTCKDKQFSLAIVDPPYGIGEDGRKTLSRVTPTIKWKNPKPKPYKLGNWDNNRPEEKYFSETIRISKNQIIWGGNYFADLLPASSCWLVWDKMNGDCDQADCELAWTSFKTAIRKFEYLWSGFKMKVYEDKIHPTQKPVKLYEWLLTNYAKPGDTILDTHGGSFSSAIAAYRLGFDFTGIELDKDYFDAAVKRFKEQTAQIDMFKEQKRPEVIQLKIEE